jgi:Fe-S-cluster containining protein
MQPPASSNSFVPLYMKDGLRFSCIGCGGCCSGNPGLIYLTQSEFLAIAEHLSSSCENLHGTSVVPYKNAFRIVELENGECTFFKNKKCSIYPVRPLQCKTYPFWFSLVRNADVWEAESKMCPGIGAGKLHTADEIVNTLYMNLENAHSYD